uniref:Reverse transcriptase domain-containing protein n=1 Tax=Anopheles stephensi TaxID=30069 RepID=A0A182YST1_ANOST
MEEKVNQKLQEMLEADIIEPVIGPANWISPMVVVPKGKDDIPLCINMRYPNKAIQREHYPLPVIDTLLNKLKGATIVSKLDITSAYYHIELHPDSRDITTFMTGRGLMRFKRLMFGINCAPEIFQRIMSEMLAVVEGSYTFQDKATSRIFYLGCAPRRVKRLMRLQNILFVLLRLDQ